jgi:uncharacterized protein (DUF1697 family)
MPELREALTGAGFQNVRTYVASGNVVLTSSLSPDRVAAECHDLIRERFGLDIPVVVRTRDELAEVVERNPFGDLAVEPKLYQVSFLAAELPTGMAEKLESVRTQSERFELIGREIYAWHPDGVGRSKLAMLLAGRGVGVTATARNWTTVTKLLEMADEVE